MMDHDYYELRASYLRRSQSYKDFCMRVIDYDWWTNIQKFRPPEDWECDLRNYEFFGNLWHPEWDFKKWFEGVRLDYQLGARSFIDIKMRLYPEAVLDLRVLCVGKLGDIIEDVRSKIKNHMDGAGKAAVDRFKQLNFHRRENNRVRPEELRRYLRVFDFCETEGHSVREFAVRENVAYDENVERSIRLDLKKAKKIISNVERCVFPGIY